MKAYWFSFYIFDVVKAYVSCFLTWLLITVFKLDYNYVDTHTKCVTLTNIQCLGDILEKDHHTVPCTKKFETDHTYRFLTHTCTLCPVRNTHSEWILSHCALQSANFGCRVVATQKVMSKYVFLVSMHFLSKITLDEILLFQSALYYVV